MLASTETTPAEICLPQLKKKTPAEILCFLKCSILEVGMLVDVVLRTREWLSITVALFSVFYVLVLCESIVYHSAEHMHDIP